MDSENSQLPHLETFSKAAELEAVMAMGHAIRSDLDPKLRELAYLKTARLTDCHY
jgi:alkylhydroperoxidase family enzyme